MSDAIDRPIPEEARKALDKAKIQLMASPDTTFFTTVCLSLRHIWDWSVPTACTNGQWIRYNPDFFLKCSPKQQVGLLLHETYHVVYQHMTRLGERDLLKWNLATDFVINLPIIERGFELPNGALIDKQYRGMSSEEVYNLLPTPGPEEVEVHFVMGELGDGGDDEGTMSPEAIEEIKNEIDNILIRAKLQSEIAGDKPGSIPGEIEFYINRLLKPRLPTAAILRRFLYARAKEDFSWQKPNRRFFPKHYLPSLYSESLGHIAVCVDASGSVDDSQFHRMVSEVGGILRQMKPKKISLVTFDTQIRSVDEVTNLKELINVKFTGRGGTAIEPVLEWCNEFQPKVVLIFTDGGFYFRQEDLKPKIPIAWLINDNPNWKAPFGRVVHYESD